MNSTPEPGETPADSVPSSDDAETVVEIADPVRRDPALLDAHDLALAALREITPATTIGEPADYRVEADGVVSLRFANRLAGYPGWFWTVSLARLEDAEPTVLEVELLPGDGALLAPDWVPWAERLADYQAAQVGAGRARARRRAPTIDAATTTSTTSTTWMPRTSTRTDRRSCTPATSTASTSTSSTRTLTRTTDDDDDDDDDDGRGRVRR